MFNHSRNQTTPATYILQTERWAWWMTVLGACAACLVLGGGCYDSQAMVDRVKSESLRERLHEVDLGLYQTTMPRESVNDQMLAMTLRLYGTVPHHQIPVVKQQLKLEGYRLRHNMLAVIRQTKRDELAEPDLTQLRTRLIEVVNNVLTEAPIESVGVEEFQIAYE